MIKQFNLIGRKILSKLVIFLVCKKQYTLLILLIIFNIKEKSNGKDRYFFSNPINKKTILALDSDRYRGELEALSFHSGIRVLFMKQSPPGWLIKPFYDELNVVRYINAKKNSVDEINHKKAYKFMISFLYKFYKYVSVDCVTTINYRYLEDYNWSKASDRLGIPFIMMYRECLLGSDRMYNAVLQRTKHQFGKFHGTHITVHNNTCKQMFVDSGYVSAEKISVTGALRMDKFLELIKQNKNKDKSVNKKTFVLFYFPYNLTLFGNKKASEKGEYKYHNKAWGSRKKLFIDLHNAIIELAVENPDIDFIIKPKNNMVDSASWSFYQSVADNSKFCVHSLSNYKVDPYLDVSKCIADASIICALQSSVVLESAIANKRLIFPLFYNFLNSAYVNDFFWKNDIGLFDIASDKNEFKKIFKEVVNNSNVPENIQYKRKELFKKWFGSVDSGSLDKYYNTIKKVTQ